MAKSVNNNFLVTRIQHSFSQVWSKVFAFNQSKVNQDSQILEDSQSEEYQLDSSSQQNLHPYLVDRVEPSIQHIIFSSYIKF